MTTQYVTAHGHRTGVSAGWRRAGGPTWSRPVPPRFPQPPPEDPAAAGAKEGWAWRVGEEAERRRPEPPLRGSLHRPSAEGTGSPRRAGLLSGQLPGREDGAGSGLVAIALCKPPPLCLFPRYFCYGTSRSTFAAHHGGGREEDGP